MNTKRIRYPNAYLYFMASMLLSVNVSAMPATLYEEWRKTPAPADGAVAGVNPPSLQWASVKHWEGRDVRYRVELADDPGFPSGRTHAGMIQQWCFYNPHARLKPGKWYWRYEIRDGDRITVKGPYSFTIQPETPVFETPTFEAFLAGIPNIHPFVVTQGRDVSEVRKSAAAEPLAKTIINQGKKAVAAAIYDGPVGDDKDLARERQLSGKASKEVGLFNSLIDAYILSGDTAMRDALLRRLEVLMKWPTHDLVGSGVLTAMTRAYDALFAELPPGVQASMLKKIEGQLRHGLAAWPGNIEGRQVENHFWQVELSANFTAALATVHKLEASRTMLEYTYELFLARFPNLATQDGGWSEGLGYFGVNKSAVVDMALLMKKIGHADVFKMPWYEALADYFLYFAPIGGRIDGFGDMHDRVGNGVVGQSMMLVVGHENQDPKALYRAAESMKESAKPVEPWYRILNGMTPDSAPALPPAGLPQARMFAGVGLAALHTDFINSANDTAVYFRSSPFGAKGHMHANQNAFNLSRRGEPMFYSSGYYTTFSDPHSLSSYRHTRAHNTILVNGCGQAFGHEGYGWIKRYLNGRQISYVCGDATMAYRPTVDEQFLELLAESKIPLTAEAGHGDGKLKLFERHLLLLRPDTVVIYDVLESEVPSDWTLLLHAMKPPTLDPQQVLHLDTGKNQSLVHVAGSQPIRAGLTDRFFVEPMDIKKKYKEMPRQYHLGYASSTKSKAMRFLTILQLADSGKTMPPVVSTGQGAFAIGGIRLHAELDPGRPASLAVEIGDARLYINTWPHEAMGETLPAATATATLLLEKIEGRISSKVSYDMIPAL